MTIPELWLGPDLNADLVPLVEQPEQWANARVQCEMLQMFQQQVGAKAENQFDVGPNYYPRLVQYDYFRKLVVLDLPLAFETPGLKAWSPDGEQAAFALQQTFDRVRAAGGTIAAFSLDDPLGASVGDFTDSPWPIERVVEPVCRVLRTGDANGVRGGITEAYPLSSAANIIRFLELVQQAGESPAHLHMDIDEQAAKQQRTNAQISADLKDLQFHCSAWGIPFGIILNGQRGDTPETYRVGFWEWFNFVRERLGGDPDRYILESWKKNNLPINLPETEGLAHTGLLLQLARQLQPTTPEVDVTWTLVKVVSTSAGTVLANPDGTVRSLNPTTATGGPYHWESRPAGTDGPYELCTPGGGTVAYNPVGEVVVYGFKEKAPNAGGFSAMAVEPL